MGSHQDCQFKKPKLQVLVREAFVSSDLESGTGTLRRSSLPGWSLRIRLVSSLSSRCVAVEVATSTQVGTLQPPDPSNLSPKASDKKAARLEMAQRPSSVYTSVTSEYEPFSAGRCQTYASERVASSDALVANHSHSTAPNACQQALCLELPITTV